MGVATPPDLFVKLVWILLTILLFLLSYYLINIGNNFVEKRKKIKYDTKILVSIASIAAVIYIIYILFNRYKILSDILLAIILSVIFSYFLNPLVNYLQNKGLKRIVSTAVVYVAILIVFTILLVSFIPRTGSEIRNLADNLTKYVDNLNVFIDKFYSNYDNVFSSTPELLKTIEGVIESNTQKLQESISNGISNMISGISGFLSKALTLILIPIITFYLLIDKNYFIKKVKEYIPLKYKDDILTLAHQINDVMNQFIKGRLLMALFVGTMTAIFLLIMNIDFAIVIGMITAIADIIPYIGPFLGFLPAVVLAFLSSPIKALWVAVFFVVIQWVENNILAPKVLGQSIGLHPLTVLLALIIGGGIFGVLGMILAVPVTAILMIIFRFIKMKYKESRELL
ncbi:MAG: AI-2E family transporter [Tissierellales bacterium]|nr:AI-2E family transporter [Tissierellales bacterium]